MLNVFFHVLIIIGGVLIIYSKMNLYGSFSIIDLEYDILQNKI